MGICVSTPAKGRGEWNHESEAMVIHVDGKLEQFKEPTKVEDLISKNPNCFLCNAESIFVDSCIPSLPDDEELQFGQIYFLLPVTKQHIPASLTDLCVLAIRAATALRKQDLQMQESSSQFYGRRALSFPARSRKGRNSSADSDINRHRRNRISGRTLSL
ncbi:uncharacterized protein LOC122074156 [Macadamia integrifolia]|uniref:uncharacterized protein LOC122074156 n=1 Tax=Macadamia integrifolia TaxID=60698 RepID=UPI001C50053D|nr:uncharacterized protein LOC122074156 [Macadamia integrifolia]